MGLAHHAVFIFVTDIFEHPNINRLISRKSLEIFSMCFVFMLSFLTQSARVDQVNGSWTLVERWDGEFIDLRTDCLGPEIHEGLSFYLSRERMEGCAPDSIALKQPIILEKTARSMR